MNIIEVENMTKSLDGNLLYNHVSFSIKSGHIVCLEGSNGSGKSVFIDCLLGFQHLDEGFIRVLNCPVNNRKFMRENTGIVSPDHQDSLSIFTPNEYFSIITDIYGLKEKDNKLSELIEQLYVESFLDVLFTKLSFGTKKKIQLIGNLLYDPALLVCDEIFEGLDTESVKVVKDLFMERAKRQKTTFFTTHQKNEADDIITLNLQLKNQSIVYV